VKPGRLARALPALLRIGWKDALAYRGELIVWMLTMTLPLIMMALFRAVAAEGALGGFDQAGFTAYFLAGLTVRQLGSSWSVWQINNDIREGAMAMRLLRPVHPLWSYLCESLAAIPVRALISVPISVGLLYAIEGDSGRALARSPGLVSLFVLSLALAFAIAFCISSMMGALALYLESALGLWWLWIGFYALLSGYLVPLSLFPRWLQHVARLTPFPSLQAVPVEILLGRHDVATAMQLIATQAAWLVGSLGVLLLVWSNAQKRFAAYGG
jgi:ABC-2 type transport system permease protein